MTTDGPQPDVTGAGRGLAQDDMSLQHPVLQRLQTGRDLSSGTRSGAAWAMSSRLGGQLLQFAGTIVTARLLVPADYGAVAVVLPIVAFAALFSSLGLAASVIHSRRVTEELLSTAFWLNTVAGFVVAGIVTGLAFPLSKLYGQPALVPLLGLASLNFALNMSVVHLALLERTLRFKQIARQELLCSLVSVTVIITTAALGFGPYSLVFGPVAYSVLRTVQNWHTVRWLPRRAPDRQSLKDLWAYSKGITGYSIVDYWSRNADNLLLSAVASPTDLGNYSRSYNVMKLPINQMGTMMSRVLFPTLARMRDDRRRLGRAWLRALALAAALTAPLTFGMAVAAPAMVEVLFGERWSGMVPIIELLGVAGLPQIMTITVGAVLRATGETTMLFRLGLLTTALSISAMLIGLPWGTVGVAAALTVEFYLELLVKLRPCLHITGLRWTEVARAMRGVVVSCFSLGAAGLAVRLLLGPGHSAWIVLVAQVGVSAAAYVGTLALLDTTLLREVVSLLRRPRLSASPRRGDAREAAVVPDTVTHDVSTRAGQGEPYVD